MQTEAGQSEIAAERWEETDQQKKKHFFLYVTCIAFTFDLMYLIGLPQDWMNECRAYIYI